MYRRMGIDPTKTSGANAPDKTTGTGETKVAQALARIDSTTDESTLVTLNATSAKHEPRLDQVLAIKKVLEGFAKHDRGKLILPCGTGKTLSSLWIREQLFRKTNKPTKTIVLEPSVALIKQTKDNWQKQKSKNFDYLCVCSDRKVDDDNDDAVEVQALRQEGAPVTTQPQKIKEFLQSNDQKDRVIYSTYQSLPKIIEAMQGTDLKFDLAIADEAHKTTGADGRLFTLMHDNDQLACDKRLYMTATPRVVAGNSSEKIVGMDDENLYGPEFHRMSFAEAIEAGILVDYKIIVAAIKPGQALTHLQNQGIAMSGIDLSSIMPNVILRRVMEEHGLKRALTFHSNRDKAKAFRNTREVLGKALGSFYIDGKMNVKKRDGIMQEFQEHANAATISNARCLTEGVDVPAIDTVMFADPKESVVDIVQATGRAIRKDPNNPNKTTGYIVLPVMLDFDNADLSSSATAFATIRRVISSLAIHDERLEAKIASTGTFQEKEGGPEIEIIDFDTNSANIRQLAEGLGNEIISQIVSCSQEVLAENSLAGFQQAKAEILALSPRRPGSVTGFFADRSPKGLSTVTNLARRAGLLASNSTPNDLADLLWNNYENNLLAKIDALKKQYPEKPFDRNKLKGLFAQYLALEEIAYKVAANTLLDKTRTRTWRRLGNLLIDLADYIWGPGVNNFSEFVTKVKPQSRPNSIGDFTRLAWRYAHTSPNTIAAMWMQEHGKTNTNFRELCDAIWGSSQDLDSYISAIREKQPYCPENIDEFFTAKSFETLGLDFYEDFVARADKSNASDVLSGSLAYAKQIWNLTLLDIANQVKYCQNPLSMIKQYVLHSHSNVLPYNQNEFLSAFNDLPEELRSCFYDLRKSYPDRPADIYAFYRDQVPQELKTKLEAYYNQLEEIVAALGKKYSSYFEKCFIRVNPTIFFADFIWGPAKDLPIDAIKARCQATPMTRPEFDQILIDFGIDPKRFDKRTKLLRAIFDNDSKFASFLEVLTLIRDPLTEYSDDGSFFIYRMPLLLGINFVNLCNLLPEDIQVLANKDSERIDIINDLARYPELTDPDRFLDSVREFTQEAPKFFNISAFNSKLGNYTIGSVITAARLLGLIDDCGDASIAQLKNMIWANDSTREFPSANEPETRVDVKTAEQEEYEDLFAKLQKATKPSEPRQLRNSLAAIGLNLNHWARFTQLAKDLGHLKTGLDLVAEINTLIGMVWAS